MLGLRDSMYEHDEDANELIRAYTTAQTAP